MTPWQKFLHVREGKQKAVPMSIIQEAQNAREVQQKHNEPYDIYRAGEVFLISHDR